MKVQIKMLKRLISILCAATMVASGAVVSVGAVEPEKKVELKFKKDLMENNKKREEIQARVKINKKKLEIEKQIKSSRNRLNKLSKLVENGKSSASFENSEKEIYEISESFEYIEDCYSTNDITLEELERINLHIKKIIDGRINKLERKISEHCEREREKEEKEGQEAKYDEVKKEQEERDKSEKETKETNRQKDIEELKQEKQAREKVDKDIEQFRKDLAYWHKVVLENFPDDKNINFSLRAINKGASRIFELARNSSPNITKRLESLVKEQKQRLEYFISSILKETNKNSDMIEKQKENVYTKAKGAYVSILKNNTNTEHNKDKHVKCDLESKEPAKFLEQVLKIQEAFRSFKKREKLVSCEVEPLRILPGKDICFISKSRKNNVASNVESEVVKIQKVFRGFNARKVKQNDNTTNDVNSMEPTFYSSEKSFQENTEISNTNIQKPEMPSFEECQIHRDKLEKYVEDKGYYDQQITRKFDDMYYGCFGYLWVEGILPSIERRDVYIKGWMKGCRQAESEATNGNNINNEQSQNSQYNNMNMNNMNMNNMNMNNMGMMNNNEENDLNNNNYNDNGVDNNNNNREAIMPSLDTAKDMVSKYWNQKNVPGGLCDFLIVGRKLYDRYPKLKYEEDNNNREAIKSPLNLAKKVLKEHWNAKNEFYPAVEFGPKNEEEEQVNLEQNENYDYNNNNINNNNEVNNNNNNEEYYNNNMGMMNNMNMNNMNNMNFNNNYYNNNGVDNNNYNINNEEYYNNNYNNINNGVDYDDINNNPYRPSKENVDKRFKEASKWYNKSLRNVSDFIREAEAKTTV